MPYMECRCGYVYVSIRCICALCVGTNLLGRHALQHPPFVPVAEQGVDGGVRGAGVDQREAEHLGREGHQPAVGHRQEHLADRRGPGGGLTDPGSPGLADCHLAGDSVPGGGAGTTLPLSQ